MPIFISESQAIRLRRAVRRHRTQIKPGKPWKDWTADALWKKVLGQIVVIGRAEPGQLLQHDQRIGRRVSIKKLQRIRGNAALQRYLHEFLLGINARYVSRSGGWKKDRKATAAAKNFRILLKAGGPRKLFKQIAAHKDERQRIDGLQKALSQYGNKGARDTLIELRLAEHCMALDARIFGILKKVGVRVSPEDIYLQLEKELREKVAEPLGISAAQLDRILFKKSKEIVRDL